MKGVRIRILPPESLGAGDLKYVIIGARYFNQWIFVRHRDRQSWELPAGHIEEGESPEAAAKRELGEETGALKFSLEVVCDYQVELRGRFEGGRLFLAEISERKSDLEHEIAECMMHDDLPMDLTYPEVQEVLFERLRYRLL